MTRMVFGSVLAIALSLAGGTLQTAHGQYVVFGSRYYTSCAYYPVYSYSYYYPAPFVRYVAPAPVYVVPPYSGETIVQPLPMYVPGYANPQPAPPSKAPVIQTKEPPVGQSASGPKVTESRMQTVDQSAPAKKVEGGAKDRCTVGFWNVSAADVKLLVDGKVYAVPRNRNVTLEVGREFTYQVNAEPPHNERVPDEKTSHEIVIR
jgi:hypothetical protein